MYTELRRKNNIITNKNTCFLPFSYIIVHVVSGHGKQAHASPSVCLPAASCTTSLYRILNIIITHIIFHASSNPIMCLATHANKRADTHTHSASVHTLLFSFIIQTPNTMRHSTPQYSSEHLCVAAAITSCISSYSSQNEQEKKSYFIIFAFFCYSVIYYCCTFGSTFSHT